MYNLQHFKANNIKEVIEFMHANPFIVLCGVTETNTPVATHVPVLVEERNEKIYLLAHIMRKQTHTIAFENNAHVLAIFSAAHTYVSATHYTHQNTAGTWNYQTVHASGTIKFLEDEALYNFLVQLTEKFEANPHSPALVQKMDEKYVQDLMKAIVAFEIEITDVQHIFKLSQNKDEESRKNIIHSFESSDDISKQEVAKSMKEFYENRG